MLLDILGKLISARYAGLATIALLVLGGLLASREIFLFPASAYTGGPQHSPYVASARTRTDTDATIRGHVMLMGRPSPPNPRWTVPVTTTMLSTSGGNSWEHVFITDQSGYFTLTTELTPGVYNWRVKHSHTLANAGSATLISGTNTIEMGQLSEGDANDDNCVNASDFSILKLTFGRSIGNSGYDARADFNGDDTVNVLDFTFQKRNFGQCGAPPFVIPTPTSTAAPTYTATATPTPIGTVPCALFPSDNIWNRNIAALPTHVLSDNYVASIGMTTSLHTDFGSRLYNGEPIGIPYISVPGTQPRVPITFTTYANESDPGPYPVPTNAPIEGGPNSTGDRHVIVLDRDACVLYELFNAYPHADGSWEARSGVVWPLDSNALRHLGWTSADAAGLPILPGLVGYDEVASGVITHALRFTAQRTQNTFLWPARHYASIDPTPSLPPMGLRLRLKASVDISGYPTPVRVILQALKDYGMFLADNGDNWSITGMPDWRWNDDVLAEIRELHGQDLEVVDESGLMINEDSGQSR